MAPMSEYYIRLIQAVFISGYLLAFVVSIHVLMTARASHTALAWIIALFAVPWVVAILYFFFGHSRFYAYAEAMRQNRKVSAKNLAFAHRNIAHYAQPLSAALKPLQQVLTNINGIDFTHSNEVRLLIDGQATYDELFGFIDKAKHYILLQFYIVRNDGIGRVLKDLLIKKARLGVKIYFLYDEWGAHSFTRRYVQRLRKAGVAVSSFHDVKKTFRNRLQLNFRNHRKIAIIDGECAFVGGINIGEEYLSHKQQFYPWRDTHLILQGPAVQNMQLSFCEDWYWAQSTALDLCWEIKPSTRANDTVLIMPTGPDRQLQTGALLITQLVNIAKHRLWLTTPYFIPDQTVVTALQLAVLRGVDVRILLPNYADHRVVYWCSLSFYNEMQEAGVKLYRFINGFMHQKVILVDEELATVGTVNLDNRSLYINFEITALVAKREFAKQVASMLNEDFKHAIQVNLEDYNKRSYGFKLLVRLSRLLAPLL